MATQKSTTTKTAARKKPGPKKGAKRAAAPENSMKQRAEKAVNIYLGVIGHGIDMLQENLESSRKQGEKRIKELEKRGSKLRTQLNERFDKLASRDFAKESKAQLEKVQEQVEDAVESVKETFSTSKAA
ncbi:MAG: hypothetical protein KDI16_06995 [Halioglobus sp.]|nr:hypothetical protein [Halioglobus sp.]